MSSSAQIVANQANAQLAAGPKTPAGQASSAMNRLSHGLSGSVFIILETEQRSAFHSLVEGLRAEYQPSTTTEEILVGRLAEHYWLTQRALRLQNDCLNPATGELLNEKLFTLYMRYQTTHDRAFHVCLKALLTLRVQRTKDQIGFESQKRQHDLNEARVRLTNARAADQEIETEVRTCMDAPLPGHTRIPYDDLRSTFKQVIGEFSRQVQAQQAA